MTITKVGRRGQLTLPRGIRRHIHVEEGDRIALILEGQRVILQPLTQTLLDLRGSVVVAGLQDFGAIRRQVATARARKAGRDEG